ncbi:hypothetical protein CZ814_00569 [Photobacterium toruni]|uniref:Uncharacterized protein n=1 Tax=Photobacterium toruni TaxID=1935446 RepID=A0A1T4N1M6_9GAMM|nr:hypothetical protein CZ814_00569 [Photobacterium toruni]
MNDENRVYLLEERWDKLIWGEDNKRRQRER